MNDFFQCGQNFTNKKYLRSHIVNVHTADQDRPHVCKLCPKGFLTQTRLNDHVARYGIKQYRDISALRPT